MTQHISTLKLHQYRYGELDGEARDGVRVHLDACDTCRARLNVQESSRVEFELLAVPDAIKEAAGSGESGWRQWLRGRMPMLGVGLALAAASLFAVRLALPPNGAEQADPAPVAELVRTKGARPAIEVWIARGGAAVPVGEGDVLSTGTQVQLRYDARDAGWISLVGRDGSGELEIYGAIEANGREGLQEAPFSLVLDDAPGPIEFIAIHSERPLTDDALRAGVAGHGPVGVELHAVSFPKE